MTSIICHTSDVILKAEKAIDYFEKKNPSLLIFGEIQLGDRTDFVIIIKQNFGVK